MSSSSLTVPLQQCLTTFGFDNLESLAQNRTDFLGHLDQQGARIQHHSVGEVLDEYRRIEENLDKSDHLWKCEYDPFFYQVTQSAKELGFVRDEDTAFSRVVYPQSKSNNRFGEVLTTWGYAKPLGRYIFGSYESEKDRVDVIIEDHLSIGALLLRRPKEGFGLYPVTREVSLDELAALLQLRMWPYYVGSTKFPVHGADWEPYEIGTHDAAHDVIWSLWGGETHHSDAVFFYGIMKTLLTEAEAPPQRRHNILDTCLSGPTLILDRQSPVKDFYTEYASDLSSALISGNDEVLPSLLDKLEPLLDQHPRRDLWVKAIQGERVRCAEFITRSKTRAEAKARRGATL